MNHTPGPWNAVEYAGAFFLQKDSFYSENDSLLDMDKCPEAEANAKVAETAPLLLESLMELAQMPAQNEKHEAARYKAMDAIKKALE